MKKSVLLIGVIVLMFALLIAYGLRSRGEETRVYFVSPEDGAVVSSEFVVRFGLAGMRIAPAGVNEEGTGHHHLLIDLDTLPALDAPLPSNDRVRHFGKGQTETLLSLPPGPHTLQLLLANYAHIPHDPPVISKTITITVE